MLINDFIYFLTKIFTRESQLSHSPCRKSSSVSLTSDSSVKTALWFEILRKLLSPSCPPELFGKSYTPPLHANSEVSWLDQPTSIHEIKGPENISRVYLQNPLCDKF